MSASNPASVRLPRFVSRIIKDCRLLFYHRFGGDKIVLVQYENPLNSSFHGDKTVSPAAIQMHLPQGTQKPVPSEAMYGKTQTQSFSIPIPHTKKHSSKRLKTSMENPTSFRSPQQARDDRAERRRESGRALSPACSPLHLFARRNNFSSHSSVSSHPA